MTCRDAHRASDALAAFSLACGLGLVGTACRPPIEAACLAATSSELTVAYARQQQPDWCWAATAAMVLGFHGRTMTQCQIVQKEAPACACTGGRVDASCKVRKWPPFQALAFHSAQSDVLEPGEIKQELAAVCEGRPFLFTWQFADDEAHIMVADGFREVDGQLWVWARDPEADCIQPPEATSLARCTTADAGDDSHTLLRYDFFNEWPGDHTHSLDFSNLYPKAN